MRKKEEASKNVKDNQPEHSHAFELRLFITGATPNSMRAVSNIKQICENHLSGNYSLEVIDVYQQLDIAEKEQLIAY